MQSHPPRPRRPMAIPRRLRPTCLIPNGAVEVDTGKHIVGEDGDQGSRQLDKRNGNVPLSLPRDKDEAQKFIQGIHNRKVACLKAAIFELQRDNSYLLHELQRQQKKPHDFEKNALRVPHEEMNLGESFDTHKSLKNEPIIEYSTPKNISLEADSFDNSDKRHHHLPTFLSRKDETTGSEKQAISLQQQIINFETQISLLQRKLEEQDKILRQRELQINALEQSQSHMIDKFKKKLLLHKIEVSAWVFGLASRTERLQEAVTQSTEMDGRVQQLVSVLEEHYRALILENHRYRIRNHQKEQQIKN